MRFDNRATTLAVAGAVCSYCGDPATCIDHIVSRADLDCPEALEDAGLSSADDLSNLTPACNGCNTSKSDLDLNSWLLKVLFNSVSPGGISSTPTLHRVMRAHMSGRNAEWVADRIRLMAGYAADEMTQLREAP